MSISIASTPVRAIVTGSTTHAVSLTGVQAGDTIEFYFVDRTGGATVSSMTDSDAGSYTQRSTLTQSTFLSRVYVRENVSAPGGGNLTVTLTTGASQNSQVVGRIVRSDAGGGVFATFDQAATAVDGASSTTAVSNTLAATAAGIISGSLSTGNSQGSTPTVGNHADLTGETVSPATEAGARSFAVYGVNAASGTLGFTTAASASVTLGTSSSYAFHLINYIQSGASLDPIRLVWRQ